MKIAVINGSPKGKTGNTNVLVEAFLKGAQEAGAVTTNIFLTEKEISHCKGCHTCWSRGPGQCVTKDDMPEVLSEAAGANIIILATPVFFENISGMLKVFMDRMTMMGSPHTKEIAAKAEEASIVDHPQAPKLMMISSCGYADQAEFEVVSLWAHRVSVKMRMKLVGEIYATQGKHLNSPPENLSNRIAEYLNTVEAAGKEIVQNLKLSDATAKLLQQGYTA